MDKHVFLIGDLYPPPPPTTNKIKGVGVGGETQKFNKFP